MDDDSYSWACHNRSVGFDVSLSGSNDWNCWRLPYPTPQTMKAVECQEDKEKIMESNGTGRDGVMQLLRTEWTKFRTVRDYVVGMVIAALVTVLPGLLIAAGSICQRMDGSACPPNPIGPGSQAVKDKFY